MLFDVFKRKVSLWLRSLHPSYWIMNHSYSKILDEWFNDNLDKGVKFEDINGVYVIKFAGQGIWVANHPYASFTLNSGSFERMRPSRMTIIRLHDQLMKQKLYD